MNANQTNTLKTFKWYFAWDDEKEEAWLREMSNKGWHFKEVSLPGRYTFVHGEPRDYVYRLDWFAESKGKPDYLQLFLDAGWDYMGEMNSWQYFRKEAIDGQAPEIFSDNESKAKKYERLGFFMLVFLPVYMNLFLFIRSESSWIVFFQMMMGVLFIFYIYAMVRLFMRINELKKKV